MTATRIATLDRDYAVDGVGYAPIGAVRPLDGQQDDQVDGADPVLGALAETAALCNDAQIEQVAGGFARIGAPTEAALIALAAKLGRPAPAERPRLREISFSSERKRMTVLVAAEGSDRAASEAARRSRAHVKGAPETVLPRCVSVLTAQGPRPLSEEDRSALDARRRALLAQGLRVLALARRDVEGPPPPDADALEADLVLIGLVGVTDPPRPEAAEAVRAARSAGVKIVMITGDAGETAAAVAQEVGLAPPGAAAVLGAAIDRMSDHDLSAALSDGAVFARTTPAHKMRIVRLLQNRGEIVAMTGDGVNDAPALQAADVGVAMGRRGSDVAKGASDLILTDDNFATIVAAIEEGRRQFDNVKKFVRYLLSSNLGEIVAIVIALLAGGPLILLPVQILWMNLVTDGATALALGFEPVERNAMRRAPRLPTDGPLDQGGAVQIGVFGLWIGVAAAALFFWTLGPNWRDPSPEALARAQTMAFTALVVLEKANVFNFKTLGAPLSLASLRANLWLPAAAAGALALQIAAVYWPPLQTALRTAPLSAADWAAIAAIACPIFILPEIARRIAARAGVRTAVLGAG